MKRAHNNSTEQQFASRETTNSTVQPTIQYRSIPNTTSMLCTNKTTPLREVNPSDMTNGTTNNDEDDDNDDDDKDDSRTRRRRKRNTTSSSSSSLLFEEDDFSCFLNQLSKEKIKYESVSFYNLWLKYYSESNSLSDCNRRFENALTQLQLQIDSNNDSYNSHSTTSNSNRNRNIDTSILLDESIPDHFKGRIMLVDAYKEYGLDYFFEGNNSKDGGGTTTSAYFEEYRKKNKGVVGTDRRKAIIRSVDPLMEILMEESNDIINEPLLHSSSSSSSTEPSRMDIKFKGRNNEHNNNYTTKETKTTTTAAIVAATLKPITPAYNNNNNNNDNNDNNGNGSGRVYRELTNNDVVFGRGGKANHHLENIRYRKEIQRFDKCYKSAITRSEKEWIVETVVHCLQSSDNGSTTTNFLEKEVGTGSKDNTTTNCSNCWWFVVEDDIIRRKVHQALRENRDPKKRKAKRQRFLAKKAAAAAVAAAAKFKTKKGRKNK